MRPSDRFDDRVRDYLRGRPGYPDGVADWIAHVLDLPAGGVIADVGAGTGLSSELFLRHGFSVVAVEPNATMREAILARLGADPCFRAFAGAAEATTLPDASVDGVIAAQAFHWFDRAAFRAECLRILRPGGGVALLWNVRRAEGSAFGRAYEALLREFGTDYLTVRHENVTDDELRDFFAVPDLRREFDNAQVLDAESLRARLLSSSYVPAAGHPRHAPMLEALEALFRDHQADGRVVMDYALRAYVGRFQSR